MVANISSRCFWSGSRLASATQVTGCFPIANLLQRSYVPSARHVHSTLKKDHTTLLSSDKLSRFNVLSLKALKGECRTRGLKLSGRKSELVDRILAFENTRISIGSAPILNTRQFHTSKPLAAKGDSKPVDDVKLPDVAATEDSLESVDKEYIVHITPLSKTADEKPVTLLEKELLAEEREEDDLPQVSTTDLDKGIFHAELSKENYDIANEDAENATETDAYEQSDSLMSNERLNAKDKTFFLSAAAVVAGWWSLKFWDNNEELQK
ncbi:LADA_0B10044g1_1 [Lachancea dasiensis]|uniref:LADA_0B10044g1_1 n=1 Tax=Lachancea dasiensis TaxID=1072105 RepID=A0A1G4IV91_9SACH|nr:LADA_0B10044g1_1 [Lachancea dasiensis]